MNKTTMPKNSDISRDWYVIDVQDQVLGRVANMIAKYLMGKNKVDYTAHTDMGNNVIIINSGKVKLTGQKKKYLDITRYSGYPGGLKTLRVQDLLENKPEDVIRHSVKGMLPKNKLRDRYMARIYIYAESTHPHEAQKPEQVKLS